MGQVKELKTGIGRLIQEKYELRTALEQCISYLESETGMTLRHPVLKVAKKALRDTTFAELKSNK